MVHSQLTVLLKACRQSGISEWLFDTDKKIKDFHKEKCLKSFQEYTAWCAMCGYKTVQQINTYKEEVAAAMGMTVEMLEDANGNRYMGFFCKEVIENPRDDVEKKIFVDYNKNGETCWKFLQKR